MESGKAVLDDLYNEANLGDPFAASSPVSAIPSELGQTLATAAGKAETLWNSLFSKADLGIDLVAHARGGADAQAACPEGGPRLHHGFRGVSDASHHKRIPARDADHDVFAEFHEWEKRVVRVVDVAERVAGESKPTCHLDEPEVVPDAAFEIKESNSVMKFALFFLASWTEKDPVHQSRIYAEVLRRT